MNPDRLLYDALGVPVNASYSEIRQAFTRAEHEAIESGMDEKKLQSLRFSYMILSNPATRRIYDEQGFEGIGDLLEEESEEEDEVFGDSLFDDEYNEGLKMHSFDIDLSLQALYNGCILPLKMTINEPCSYCGGTGTRCGSQHPICPSCNGSGRYFVQLDPVFPSITTSQICPDCFGRGYLEEESNLCTRCYGRRYEKRTVKVQVRVPPGTDDGAIIPVRGYQNVEVVIHQKPNPVFEKRGCDLLIRKKISLSQALLGGSFAIKHLDGRLLVFEIKEKVISHGDTHEIQNEGFRDGGSLFVLFEIEFPKRHELTSKLITEFDAAFPREHPNIDPLNKNIYAYELQPASKRLFGKRY